MVVKTTMNWAKKDMWVKKGEEHEGRLLGLKQRGRVISGRNSRPVRLARLDYAGPCGPW